MKANKEQLDPLVQQIGEIGKWQVVTFVVLSLFCIPVAWQILAISFYAPSNIDHWCTRPAAFSNWSVQQWRQYSTPYTEDKKGNRKWDTCHIYDLDYDEAPPDPNNAPAPTTNKTVRCPRMYGSPSRWEFDHSFHQWTIVEHFGLVCEFGYLKAIMNASYMAGVMIGAIICGMTADRFGRRPVLLAVLGAMVVMALVVTLSETAMVFVVLRFFLAMLVMSEYTTAFVFCMETLGGTWRLVLGLLFQVPFGLGIMMLAGMAYSITNWQYLQLAISLPMLLFFIYYWTVPESPRWLLAAGKVERASALIESIAEINGREFDPDIELVPPHEQRQHVYVHELLRHPTVRYRTLNVWFNWFANMFLLYGLLFSFAEVGNSLYLNMLIGGAVEIPAYLISIVICLWCGRKWPLAGFMIAAGGFILATIAIERGVYERDWPVLLLTTLSRFCISASVGIVYVYTAEVFPTVLRNTGVSSSSTCGRVGAILAPLVPTMMPKYEHFPALAYGVVSVLAGLLILLMPETRGEKMPDTMNDVKQLGRKDGPAEKAAAVTSPWSQPNSPAFPPIAEEETYTGEMHNRAFEADPEGTDQPVGSGHD